MTDAVHVAGNDTEGDVLNSRETLMRSVVLVSAVLIGAATAAPLHDLQSKIDDAIRPFLADKPFAAVVVGVVTPRESRVFGYGSVSSGGRDQAPDGTTLFALGSLTKAYTGVLLADLARAGIVKLDDPAQRSLPPDLVLPQRGDRPITLLDLATHHSGLPVQPPNLGWRNLLNGLSGSLSNPYAHYDRARLARELAETELESDPGAKFEYSNLGVGLLGHALATAGGAESFDAILTARVCQPLGLNDTRIRLSEEQRQRLAPGHNKSGKAAPHWEFATLEACGGLFSTADDQVRFLRANLGLQPTPLFAALTDSHEPRRGTSHEGVRVGLGWMNQPLGPDSKSRVVWHNGGTFAAHSFLGFVPDSQVGIVILNNSDHKTEPIAFGLLRKLAAH